MRSPVILRSAAAPPCHSEERSDEESLEAAVLRDEHRSFAEPVLSEVEGLRMTEWDLTEWDLTEWGLTDCRLSTADCRLP
jgi:hypothetical protein